MPFESRTRETLMVSLNNVPRPESIVQNQRYLLEVLCDIRDELKEVLQRLSWLKQQPLEEPIKSIGPMTVVIKAKTIDGWGKKLEPETVPVTTKKPEPEDLPEWLGGGEEEETI